jgi:hypothetical protein
MLAKVTQVSDVAHGPLVFVTSQSAGRGGIDTVDCNQNIMSDIKWVMGKYGIKLDIQ